jgi:photosystem II biogenesis protein Psp29
MPIGRALCTPAPKKIAKAIPLDRKMVDNRESIFKKCVQVSNLSTVSDTKRKFYDQHNRPINSIFRRVVEELLVEMHLLSVNEGFKTDAIYALGVVSSYDKFMANYRPEEDKPSIFTALCQSMGSNGDTYRQEATALQAAAKELPGEDGVAELVALASSGSGNRLAQTLQDIMGNQKFKYSRLFGIGLFTLLESIAPGKLEDEAARTAAIEKLAPCLNLPGEKVGKDWDSYRSSLTKLAQMEAAMADVIEADRKKREQREQEKANSDKASSESTESTPAS